MKNISLIEMTPDELVSLINDGLKKQLESFKNEWNQQQKQEELLSREETCSLLKIDSSTLWRWTQQGRVQSHSISGRRYYKRNEIMAALKNKDSQAPDNKF